jgi:hypothetical protein
MQYVYLGLAVIGTVVPYWFYGQHFMAQGASLSAFLSAIVVNPAVKGLDSDLVLGSLGFWLLMFRARRKGTGPQPIWFILLNLLVGLSCALPVYLYIQERTKS